MNNVIEVLLTAAANIVGYALAAVIVVGSARRARRKAVQWGFGDAALALFVFFSLVMVWYVVTEYWLGTKSPHDPPGWLEATNGAAENIQSEIFQVWLAALVFKHLRWPGSPESKE
jgi:predicted acyltransferase